MAKDEQTGSEVAKLAALVLRGNYDDKPGSLVISGDYAELLRVAYALAGSCLTQAPDKTAKKKPSKLKAKKK